ncbi:hemolysin family protein [Corynebacterium sp. ES2794-CONJ1]|uniref:hemolysin family protein n=1 Tax=unclassified Corynebacterium TaxID=2624378 RepID=UPI0021685418|nr:MULTISPECIES: hemolysin family protein [unclassified Corynebacterium]MCS4491185.1 hemolysin family protein [Corynebacterium sp. ES2715-CONJ3]MCS4530934.1 hemolysin family protein [Corynebacterium sp. ES2730-CONJ]MCU9518301.1 hemolysin family protein [Corynebacterium sp. ES2794-CONJ1]
MEILSSILGLVGFVLLTASTGLFVAVEFALTGLERSTIDHDLAVRGDKLSHAVKRDYSNLSFVLSGAQLGITITTLATGYLAEPILAKFLNPLLGFLGVPMDISPMIALVLALIIATFLSMVFGELVPKNLAITDPLGTARLVVTPVHIFNVIFKGFIRFLNTSANFLVRKIGIEPADELATARSTQELTALVRNSAKQGELDENTALVLDRSLRFGETTAEELMTPRSTIETLSHDETVLDLIALAHSTGHSRFPVIRGDLDETLGVVHFRDAFAIPSAERGTTTLKEIARPVKAIPESLDGDAVLAEIRAAGSQMILVADEYGGTAGIITVEDVVEEILGDFYDEHDDLEAEKDFQKFGTYWQVSGLVRLDELAENVGYIAPEGPYETLGGLIMAEMGRIPDVNDTLVLPESDSPGLAEFTSGFTDRWQAQVIVMEDRRIDKVILMPISPEDARLKSTDNQEEVS